MLLYFTTSDYGDLQRLLTISFLQYFSLGDVQIAAVDVMSSVDGRAYEVEHCSCGVGYSGLSCEVCTRLSCYAAVQHHKMSLAISDLPNHATTITKASLS